MPRPANITLSIQDAEVFEPKSLLQSVSHGNARLTGAKYDGGKVVGIFNGVHAENDFNYTWLLK